MRYGIRKIIDNRSRTWQRALEERGVGIIRHYSTPRMKHPNIKQIQSLTRVKHRWKMGDRYYKLAHKHYGNSRYWWVIAWYNRRPTEAHVKLGNVIYIPLPLENVLRIMEI